VRIGAAFWIQRTDWPALREACQAAEAAGFDSIWLDDHLLSDEGDWTAPKLEGWAALAAVASATSSVRLGHLVTANTFRNPFLVAKQAVTLDHLSGGRFVLGLGGGWFEREHDAFGLDFGAGFGERLDRLEEAVSVIRQLLDGRHVTHEGRDYRLHDAVLQPKPVQAHLPILVGGSGRTKTLATVARHADLWNGYGRPERIAEVSGWLRDRCADVGRRFEDIERTVVLDVVIRDSTRAAAQAYDEIETIHGIHGRIAADGTSRGLSAGGPPAVVADALRPYAELGIAVVMWLFRSPFDLETMGRLGDVRRLLA
jgi:alkanesulfonate monooxygenase SsuD/methylene tetrahydromethanopterin reductase-like flavin-dependent oxidoreductase (luciferase family)